MGYKEEFKFWLEDSYFDEETKKELQAIQDDEKEVEDRFYKELEFGTGGLRGVIGAGTNRMNIYTVRKATQGLANYILKKGGADKGIAIAYDSRLMSPEFADGQHFVWQQTESKHMYLTHFAPHRSFPLHCAN